MEGSVVGGCGDFDCGGDVGCYGGGVIVVVGSVVVVVMVVEELSRSY